MIIGQKVLITVMVVVGLFAFYVTLDANKYRATVLTIEGEGRVGVNPTTEALDFGDLSPGTSAIRKVTIENGIGLPIYVVVARFGSITDLLTLNKNFFSVPAGGSDQIEMTVYMPASAPIGERLEARVFLFKIPYFF